MLTLCRLKYVLIAIFLMALVFYVCTLRSVLECLNDVSLNVGTEVFGILFTVWLIDEVIRRKDQTERERIVKVAFAQLRIALEQHINTLLCMYKASISHAPQINPQTLDDLFGPDYCVQLAFLDLSKSAPLVSVNQLQWFDYLYMEMENFKATLIRTLEKYAVFLEPNTVELLEEVLASSFIGFLMTSISIPEFDQKRGFKRQYNLLSSQGMPELIQQHTDLIKRLTQEANRHFPNDKQVGNIKDSWRNDIAPTFGSARLNPASET